MTDEDPQKGPDAADNDPRTWFTGESLKTLIHRAEYGESVADNIVRGRRLYGKAAGYAALYARALLPALRELEKARKAEAELLPVADAYQHMLTRAIRAEANLEALRKVVLEERAARLDNLARGGEKRTDRLLDAVVAVGKLVKP